MLLRAFSLPYKPGPCGSRAYCLAQYPYIWAMLKRISFFLVPALLALVWWGCSAPYVKPSDPTEAGKDFLNAALKADYKVTDGYILKDTLNKRLFKNYKQWYNDLPESEKDAYSKASLTIYSVNNISDSTTIISFANSYKNQKRGLRLVKNHGEWWVDFAYTFTDTLSGETQPGGVTNTSADSSTTNMSSKVDTSATPKVSK